MGLSGLGFLVSPDQLPRSHFPPRLPEVLGLPVSVVHPRGPEVRGVPDGLRYLGDHLLLHRGPPLVRRGLQYNPSLGRYPLRRRPRLGPGPVPHPPDPLGPVDWSLLHYLGGDLLLSNLRFSQVPNLPGSFLDLLRPPDPCLKRLDGPFSSLGTLGGSLPSLLSLRLRGSPRLLRKGRLWDPV